MSGSGFTPLEATAILWRGDDEAGVRGAVHFLGSGLMFRRSGHLLTAAHCVRDVRPDNISIQYENMMVVGAESVTLHPQADLALVRYDDQAFPQEPFQEIETPGLGHDFYAFGFPETVEPDATNRPAARLFKGTFQRFWQYDSGQRRLFRDGEVVAAAPRYQYDAAEMSIPAPAGLSGGPVFRSNGSAGLLGMVTANVTSMRAADSEDQDSHRYLAYGVAIPFYRYTRWLDSVVPAGRRRH